MEATTSVTPHKTEAITLMFDRPMEPLLMPKGKYASWVFELPDAYLKSRHRSLSAKIKKRFARKGVQPILVKNTTIPDISILLQISRSDNFSLLLPKHREIAGVLIDIFMEPRNCQDLISTAAYVRDRVNPYLFNYALSVVLLHREDTRDITLPNFLSSFPGKFVDSRIFLLARQEATVIPDDSREPIVVPPEFTANLREPEQVIAYFREDVGVNLHHWHWHLVYPAQVKDHDELVKKDRRGELFYYMHQQILARYNSERFSNAMPKVESLAWLKPGDIMTEAYFSKLQIGVSGRSWPPRFANTPIFDLDRPDYNFAVKKEVTYYWINNIKDALAKGYVVNTEGGKILLDEMTGIDILGNMIESSILSPNKVLYGDLHNIGHIFISLCHDPDGKYLEGFSVMGDTATAMRDPVFYCWHVFINNIFLSFKNSLPQYTIKQLEYPNISITDLHVQVPNKMPNELFTFWEQSDMDLSRGLDFAPRGPLYIRFTHLQHEDFTYSIKVRNARKTQVSGTIRIFLLPKFDDKMVPINFEEQRKLAIELDKFKVPLRPGYNIITRKSLDSSVTIPYERTYRDLDSSELTGPDLAQFNFCGCGWPHNMLIPKGNIGGLLFDLFAMVSDYEVDRVVQDTSGICNDADSYCGVLNKLYPDRRSMGYPFDRVPREGVTTLADFLTPNMNVTEVKITFTDRVNIRAEQGQEPVYSVLPAEKPNPLIKITI